MKGIIIYVVVLINNIKSEYEPAQSPSLGIVALDKKPELLDMSPYIYRTIIKFLEQVGFKWIPIFMHDSKKQLEKKLSLVNGLVFTGGGQPIFEQDNKTPSKYMRLIEYLVKRSQELNDRGIKMPIFGVCLGFQSLAMVLSNYQIELLCNFRNLNRIAKTNFYKEKIGIINQEFNPDDLNIIRQKKIFNYHHNCGYKVEDFQKNKKLNQNVIILAESVTALKQTVVAAFQHKKYPFFAIQFHPEKTQFASGENMKTNISNKSVLLARKMALIVRHLVGKIKQQMSNEEIQNFKENITFQFDLKNSEMYYWPLQYARTIETEVM